LKLKKSIQSALENIYISPLELCNLNCQACYTQKTPNILSNQEILDFVEKYSSHLRSMTYDLRSIIFCGGEVFTLSDFPNLVNTLIQKDIFISIITNGTIDRLEEIKDPKNCQLLISLDGPKEIHDQNRGVGNFDKTIKFIKHAQELKFPVEIMFLVTKDSYQYKDSFDVFDLPKTCLTDRKLSLTHEQVLNIKQHYQTFPNKNFGCFQLSLQSTGVITGCCESSLQLGTINDNPSTYVANFIKSLSKCSSCQQCDGCCDPNYFCGYKTELKLNTCQDVIDIFNKSPCQGRCPKDRGFKINL
jgi:sulfatase maturation enzyme AslB (radical SAM superfamily)